MLILGQALDLDPAIGEPQGRRRSSALAICRASDRVSAAVSVAAKISA